MTDRIEVPFIAPNLPVILCDAKFLGTLSDVEAQVAALKITDAQSAQQAADLQVRLTGAGRKLEEVRVELKKPYLEMGRKLDEAARAPSARIEAAKTTLRFAQIEWDTRQRHIAAEAERARQAELQRLDKLRQAEEAEARRKADELAAIAAKQAKDSELVTDVDFGDEPEPAPPSEIEKQIEAVKYAPAPVAAKPTGVRFKVSLIPIVEDVNKLPDMFVVKTANMRGIISTFCSGWKEGAPLPECAGVRFEVERTVDSTGRARF